MLLVVESAAAMEALGGRLAGLAWPGMQIHLSGPLGAGKTTLVRGFLRRLAYTGTVKSPTYTLVEPYQLATHTVYHFDFYRVERPAEVEAIGFRDYRADGAILLIEWPEMAGAAIGNADLTLRIEIPGSGDRRKITLVPHTAAAKSLISGLV